MNINRPRMTGIVVSKALGNTCRLINDFDALIRREDVFINVRDIRDREIIGSPIV